MIHEKMAGDYGYITATPDLDPSKPTLVFIHGSSGSSLLWRDQVEALAGQVNAVALDLPGHGRSAGPHCETVEDYAKAVIGFVDALQAPRPIPCGLSIGGAIAIQLLLDWKDRFDGGILVNTGARLRVSPAILETIEHNYNGYVQSLRIFAAAGSTDPARLEALIEDTAKCPPEVALADFKACDRFDAMGRIPEIRVPVLVMTAEEDELTPPKYGDFLEKNIPKAGRAHIMAAGHLSPVEQPEAVSRAIQGFIEQVGW